MSYSITNLRRISLVSTALALGAGLSLTILQAQQQPHAATKGSVLDAEVIARTPERLARGEYLVNGLLWCQYCHSSTDFGTRPAHVRPGTEFGGQVLDNESFGMPEGTRLIAPNISPDLEYGAGKWKDADFVRVLRQGIGHDGRTLFPMMPYARFREMSDEDLASVIVYVRSQKPVHVQQPKSILPPAMMDGVEPFPVPAPVVAPVKSKSSEYGKYLARAARCEECHSPGAFDDKPVPRMAFGGGEPFDGPFGLGGAKVHIVSLNLTPDPSGISYFDEAMFIKTIRSGEVGARELMTVMPWSFFRNLDDQDLGAIFAYLRTLPPAKHKVDNTEPPTFCKICGNKHGLGCLNEGDKVETPATQQ